MKIYLVENKATALLVRELIALNTSCVSLEWSTRLEVPINVIEAAQSVAEYAEITISKLCEEYAELSDSQTDKLISMDSKVKAIIATGVIINGEETTKLKHLIGSDNDFNKLVEAIDTEKNVVLF